ncbi:MAG: 16S rRNA (guanine(966)-N(2))-methyltransferase RsmD [Candidatus Omnitrophota bacterium]|nr:16S rRNA (guanine(966)-N(2))-methyltransferase RsmD [Candidatus Omnitrophota bacterium]
MRILSGRYKGRLIQMPNGIRPTQDKARKALFDILGDIEGSSFLELFAGSGAVGFEAVSRGVAELTLVEYSPACLMAIRKNIESLKLKACDLYPKEASDAIEAFHKNKREFDIIFLDPPYYREMSKKILQMPEVYDILAPDGFVVVQHFKKESLPKESGKLILIKESRYGDTLLSFYRKVTINQSSMKIAENRAQRTEK